MANFLYNGVRLDRMIAFGGPVAPASPDKYLASGSNLGNFHNSYHSFTANNSSLQFTGGGYNLNGNQFYNVNACSYVRIAENSPGYQGFPSVTDNGASGTWRTTTIYTNPTETGSRSVQVINDPTFGTPNRAYCVLVGGGGGGRDRGTTSGNGGQGGGGGGGQTFGLLINLDKGANTIVYNIGGGGRGGKSGEYYSNNPASPSSGSSVDGQKGGSGGPTTVWYGSGSWTAYGGEGGNGGVGGDSGARGNGGNGAGYYWDDGANHFTRAGNRGTHGNEVNVSVKAYSGNVGDFAHQSTMSGALNIRDNIINFHGNGGAGGTSDRDAAGNGQPADDGAPGCLYMFFYYNMPT